MLKSILTATSHSINAALFPSKCLICRTFIDNNSFSHSERLQASIRLADNLKATDLFEGLFNTDVCPHCRDDFIAITSPLCLQCGIMFTSRRGGDHLCGDCLSAHRPKLNRVRSAGVYDGALMALIHQFKYRGRTYLARPLGEILYHTFGMHWQPEQIDMIVPVPLHKRRLRQRGFNQAHLLLTGWWRHPNGSNKNVSMKIEVDNLCRTRWTRPHTGLGREERRRNIRGAFQLMDVKQVKHCAVLLVDDVYTTGATISECARVLLQAGARRVDALTLARAM